MPRMLRLPGEDVLPPGPKRAFVTELHIYFRDAGRPSPARVAELTGRLKVPLSVSRETIRRLLVGETLSSWPKVDAVLQALCGISTHDPDFRRWPEEDDRWAEDDPSTCREHLRRLWNDAVDDIGPNEAPTAPRPAPQPSQPGAWPGSTPSRSGWSSSPSSSATPQTPAPGKQYSDEPPF